MVLPENFYHMKPVKILLLPNQFEPVHQLYFKVPADLRQVAANSSNISHLPENVLAACLRQEMTPAL